MALAECCISQQIARETPRLIGAQVDLLRGPAPPERRMTEPVSGTQRRRLAPRLDALLFGETQGRVIISVAAVNAGKVLAQAKILASAAARIGTVGGDGIADQDRRWRR